MQAGLALQYAVVAVAVLVAACVVMKKQFPQATRRLLVAIAVPMVRERRPAWMRRLGARIAPPSMRGGDGCGGCDGCG